MTPTQTIEGTTLTIDRTTYTIRFERTLDAPPADAFDAWTQPDQMKCWWDPTGEPLEQCDIDLKPGGAFSFVSKHHTQHPFTGRYVEIVTGVRLVFEAMGATGRVLFGPAGEQTKLTVDIQCASDEHLDQFIKMGVHEGTARTIRNLADFVAEARAHS